MNKAQIAGEQPVIVYDNFDKILYDKLGERYPIINVPEKYHMVKGIVGRSVKIPRIEMYPQLEFMIRGGVVVTNFPIKEATERGVIIARAPANAWAVAELTMDMLGVTLSNLVENINYTKSTEISSGTLSHLESYRKTLPPRREKRGKMLVVVGYKGRVGKAVCELAHGARMKVYGYDPAPLGETPSYVTRVETLEEAMKIADVISLNATADDDTPPVLTSEMLHIAMKERWTGKKKHGLIILNPSRRTTCVETAIAEGLSDGAIYGYWSEEGSVHALQMQRDFPGRVHVTSHIGASTEEAEYDTSEMTADNVIALNTTGTVRNGINVRDTGELDPPTADYTRIRFTAKKGTCTYNDLDHFRNSTKIIARTEGEMVYVVMDCLTAVADIFPSQLRRYFGDNILVVTVLMRCDELN